MTFDEEKTNSMLNLLAENTDRAQKYLPEDADDTKYLLKTLELGFSAIVSAIRETKKPTGMVELESMSSRLP